MDYLSTRQHAPAVTVSPAIAAGLAPDGGLYVPRQMPCLDPAAFDADAPLAVVANQLIAPFFAGDALAEALPDICHEAFTFAAPLTSMPWANADLLELFHGPTAAFKDFGARFLAACVKRLHAGNERPLTVLVATSGDTGAAVAAAFHRVPGIRVVIVYPAGRVSPRQAHQLGCFGDNVRALRVAGTFDECQQLVKQALADVDLQAHVPLTSANSISLGRLLPQMSYYAQVALRHQHAHGELANFIIPTGNLGNALACIWARAVGLPIGAVHLASNANATLPDFFAGAEYRPRPGVATLANAMDIGAPNNFERLRWLWQGDDVALRQAFTAGSVDDATIRSAMGDLAREHDLVVCPHTATAMHELTRLRAAGDTRHWHVVSTAHPAKFERVVEPLVGHAVPVPPALAALLERSAQAKPLTADYVALRDELACATASA
ncbi:MAG TPA: threonine synthase [Rhodanobacteraceae bacterium]